MVDDVCLSSILSDENLYLNIKEKTVPKLKIKKILIKFSVNNLQKLINFIENCGDSLCIKYIYNIFNLQCLESIKILINIKKNDLELQIYILK